jgi:hypothetical protein
MPTRGEWLPALLFLAVILCFIVQGWIEHNDYATLAARYANLQPMSPNGCVREFDGLDYYWVCTR